MIKCAVLYPSDLFESSTVDDLIASNHEVDITFLPQKNFASSSVAVIIAFELVKDLAYNTSYDLMKYTIVSILGKMKRPKRKNTTITITNGPKKSQISFPFELTEEQKDRMVDAAIQKLLE